VTYASLRPAVNDLLCTLNTVFLEVQATKGGVAFFSYFGGLFVPAVLVAVYEGFRPSSRRSASSRAHGNAEGFGMHLGLAQLATLALALGQVVTAGIALPLYYSLVAWSTPRRWRHHHHKVDLGDDVFLPKELRDDLHHEQHKHSVQYNANIPRSSFLYTTLVSAIVGMLVPTLYMQYMKQTNDPNVYTALSFWHPFPLYMLVINIVLPPLLRRSFTSVAPMRGIWLIAALGIVASVKSQVALVRDLHDGNVTLSEVFLFSPNMSFLHDSDATALRPAAQFLLVLDFIFVLLTTGSKVVLALVRRNRTGAAGAVRYTLALLAGSALAGPGAAIMTMWAYGELVALRHAREVNEAKKAKSKKEGKKTK
jgi:hypothetical protein